MTDFDDSQFDQFDEFEEESAPPPKQSNRTFVIAVGALVSVFLIVIIAIVIYIAFVQPSRTVAREQQVATANAQSTAIVLQASQTVMVLAMNQTQAAAGQALMKTSTAAASKQQLTIAASPKPPVMLSATQAASATLIPMSTQVIMLPSETPLPTATVTLSAADALANDPVSATATARAILTVLAGGQVPLATQSGPITQLEAMTSTARVILRSPTARATLTALPNTGFADEVGLPLLLGGAALLLVIIFFSRRLRTANR